MKTFIRRLGHSWRFVRNVELPDFSELSGMHYTHPELGCEFFHVLNPSDTNCSFVPFFKTVPFDDTGRFHIIEHCTLAGPTKKYPVENLFFKMCKKSLHTYMNAWTSNTWTAYPFSSKNEVDFSNLLDVYLECLFFPEIPPIRFEQEGISLVTDPVSNSLKFGGVVMNEMKGMVCDPSTFSSFSVNRNLYKGTCYEFNYGGDPLHIPELLLSKDFEDLRETYFRHYNPSNAKFVLYGNQENIDNILEFIEEKISQIPRPDEGTKGPKNVDFSDHIIPSRSDVTTPIEILGPPQFSESSDDNHDIFYTSYLCCDDGDTFDSLALSFLSSVFFDRPRGIFYENLVQTGLIKNFTSDTGFDRQKKKTSFHFGLEGFRGGIPEDIMIEDILMELGENGVEDTNFLESLVHQMRLGWKVIDWNEFGLNVATNVVHDWGSSGDCPERSFQYLEMIDRLEEIILDDNKSFFSEYVEKFFLENDEMTRMKIIPDPDFFERMSEEEEKVLERVCTEAPHLFMKDVEGSDDVSSPADENEIVDDDEHNLPSLSIKRDIPVHPTIDLPDLGLPITREGRGVELFFNPQPSNGIVHLSVQKELNLPPEQEFLTELMKYFIGIIETLSHDSHTLKNEIQKRTENVIPMLELQHEVMNESIFIDIEKGFLDPEKKSFIISSLEKKKHFILNRLLVHGNTYASLLSKSRLYPLYETREKMSGLHFIRDLMNLLDDISINAESNEEQIITLVEQFQNIYEAVMVHSNGTTRYVVTSDEEILKRQSQEIESHIFDLSPTTFNNDLEQHKEEVSIPKACESDPLYVDIQSLVNYCSYSYPTGVIRGDPDYILLKVLSKLIRSNFLLPKIREESGAYGANAGLDNGVFSLTSYRDPNIQRTLGTFDDVHEYVMKNVNGPRGESLLKEAKIEVFRDLDKVVENGHVLAYPFLLKDWKMEDEMVEREVLFDVSLEDLKNVCEKYIVGDQVSCVVLGGSQGEGEEGFEFKKMVDL